MRKFMTDRKLKRSMESPLAFVLILATIAFKTAPTYSQSIHASENPVPVGSNVTLMSNSTVSMGAWMFNTTMIVFINPENPVIAADWIDRVTFSSTTSSLTIWSVQLADSGLYTLQSVESTNSFLAELTLSVQESTESVMIRSNSIPINYENFTLTCEVTGSYDMIYWKAENITLYNSIIFNDAPIYIENNTLLFSPVTVKDFGVYRCVATNQAGSYTSPPYQLTVNYGPMDMMIFGPDFTYVGNFITLECLAFCQPQCEYHWFFNDRSTVFLTGNSITFFASEESDGSYICEAWNPVTNFTAYQATFLTVFGHASHHVPSHGALMVMGLFALSVSLLFN